jgi:hypothetical protein
VVVLAGPGEFRAATAAAGGVAVPVVNTTVDSVASASGSVRTTASYASGSAGSSAAASAAADVAAAAASRARGYPITWFPAAEVEGVTPAWGSTEGGAAVTVSGQGLTRGGGRAGAWLGTIGPVASRSLGGGGGGGGGDALEFISPATAATVLGFGTGQHPPLPVSVSPTGTEALRSRVMGHYRLNPSPPVAVTFAVEHAPKSGAVSIPVSAPADGGGDVIVAMLAATHGRPVQVDPRLTPV